MKMKQRSILLALGVFLVFSLAGVSFGQGDIFVKDGVGTLSKQKWAPGEIIVKFKAGVSQDVIRQMNQTHGNSVLSISKRGKFHRLGISKNRTVEEMVSIYSQNPNVEYAEPNFIASALFTPNDTYYYPYQWNMHDSPGGINMGSAWDWDTTPPLHGGDPTVVVAVIDTGVAYENNGKYKLAPDLANTAFVQGWDFINNDSQPNDDHSHGTHVTGTIAQSTNNSLGTAGVAFNTSIMPIKVLDQNGYGSFSNVADGIYYAADNGANVINMSLGDSNKSNTLENALVYAYGQGVTIVCAAGNSYQEGNPAIYPAAYDDYCIAVGAIRYDEIRSFYSSTGTYLDIAAPGGDTSVDQNGDGYADGVLQQTFNPQTKNTGDFAYYFFQGTSMASPHVAGVAALLIANGVTGPENVREALESTAKKPPCLDGQCGNEQCWSEEYGWGILDAVAALNYSPQTVSDVAVCGLSTPPSPVFEGDVSVSVIVANPGTLGETFTVTLYDNNALVESQPVSLAARETANLTFIWGATIGPHTLKAEADLASDEINTNNSMVTTVTVQESTGQGQDVAVIGLTAPPEVTKGVDNIVSVTATIVNFGEFPENITVSLYDVTDDRQIDDSLDWNLTPFLPSLTFLEVTFDWDITAASIGTHELRVDVTTASVDPFPGDNSMTTYTTVNGGINQPPVAVDDSTVTDEGTPVTMNVISNDTDADGTIVAATVAIITNPVNGTAFSNSNGTVTYTPDSGFTGTDTFTYTVDDDQGATSNEATVAVTVVNANNAPVAVDDAFNVNENTSDNILGVLLNDSDPDGDTLVITEVGTTDNGGTVIINNGTDLSYTPAVNYVGVETFDYTVSDGKDTMTATVTATVNDVNQPLVAAFSVDPTSGAAPLTVQFTDLSTGGVITNWNWKIERYHEKRNRWINVTDLTGKDPSVVLEKAGSYRTTLTVTGPGGSDSTQTQVGDEIIVTGSTKGGGKPGGGNGGGPKNK